MIFFCLDVSNEIWALWLFRVYRCFIGDHSTQSYRDYSTVIIFFLKIAICGVFGCLKILKGDGDFGDAKGKKSPVVVLIPVVFFREEMSPQTLEKSEIHIGSS